MGGFPPRPVMLAPVNGHICVHILHARYRGSMIQHQLNIWLLSTEPIESRSGYRADRRIVRAGVEAAIVLAPQTGRLRPGHELSL
jgi:hypothetical protein